MNYILESALKGFPCVLCSLPVIKSKGCVSIALFRHSSSLMRRPKYYC